MKKLIGFLIIKILLISTNSSAFILTVDCDNFKGPALYYKGGKMEVQNDGYKNTTWTFVVNSDHPSEVIYIYKGPYAGKATRKTRVLLNNEDQITFADKYPEAVFLYSLYPEHKIAYLTVHKTGTLGEAASANTSFSKCSFTKSD